MSVEGGRQIEQISPRDVLIDTKMHDFGPGARAFPDFLTSMFPESPEAKEAARTLIGWAVSFVQMDPDWPILEIQSNSKDISPNLQIGFDRKKGQIYISGSFLEINLPLYVFRSVSVAGKPLVFDSGPQFVEFSSQETAGHREQLTIFAGGKVVYKRTPVMTIIES